MPSGGPDFSRLHQLLQSLKKVQDQLARGPRQIKLRQKKTEDVRAELTAKEVELKFTRSEADKKGLDLKTKEAHLLEMKRKLNAASSNREYEIITGQIDADTAAKAVLEDEILEYMDRVEGLQNDVAECKKRIDCCASDTREFASNFESKAAGLIQEEQAYRVKVKEATKVVPTEIRDQFFRMVEAYGPDAMADCSAGVCSHCFVQMTPQARVMLNNGKSLFCGSCGRLNYLADAD